MLQEKRSTWRGFIRKIGMIGLAMLLLLPNMLMGPVSQAFADEGDYEFLQNGETITITRYLGTDTNVNIPEQIMGKEVTEIAAQAFFGKKLDTVTIPRTVTTIGPAAFMGSELEAVTFNEGLIEIGLMAFAGSKMEHVDIPGTVTTIGPGAFSQGILRMLTLREGLKTIEDKAFWDNELLSVTIPDGVTTIGEEAFIDNKLEEVNIPGTVLTVGARAFIGGSDSNNIRTLTLDEGLETISEGTFSGNSLESVSIPSSVLTLGDSAFADNPLKEVKIYNENMRFGNFTFNRFPPPDLTLFGYTGSTTEQLAKDYGYTFELLEDDEPYVCGYGTDFECEVNHDGTITITGYDKNAPKHVVIPDTIDGKTVTHIGDIAFIALDLTGIELPNGLISIGDSAFYRNSITTVIIPSGVISIGGYVFSKNQLKNVSIPDSVTTIGDYVFEGNSLTEVIIPSGIDRVGFYVFENNRLKIIDIGGTSTIDGYYEAFVPDYEAYPNFMGWYTDENYNHAWNHTVTAPMTIYGKWGYTVSFDTGGGTTVDSQTIHDNGTITMPDAPSKAGDIFGGWYVDEELTTLWDFDHGVTKDMTLYAKWVPYVCGYGTDFECEVNHDGTITITGYTGTSQELVIPGTISGKPVTVIGQSAFAEKDLESVTIPNAVTSIGAYAFYNNSLQKVTIPESVMSIGEGAIMSNPLEEFTVLSTTTSIDPKIFSQDALPNPEELTIRSYCGSTANELANLLGHSFEQLEANECLMITLIPSETEPTNKDVTVTIDVVNGEASEIKLKWGKGDKDLAYFQVGDGDDVTGSQFTVTENGVYTVYTKDKVGNERVDKIRITNIDKSLFIIHVQIVDGKTITLHVNRSDSIQQLRQKIQDDEGIATEKQKITFEGHVLEDGRTLADYPIPDQATLQLTVLSSNTSPNPGGGVYIPSSDISLDKLEVYVDGKNRLPFDPTLFEYDLGDTEAETVEIIVKTHHSKAKITLNGEAFVDEQTLRLNEGKNIFEIMIFAENGDKQTYTISVNRLDKVPFADIAGQDNPISRLEVTRVLVRLLQLDERKQVPFTDVQSLGKDAMEELEKAYANGVVKGYPDQTFKSYADVTRAHLALILYRTYEKVNGTPYQPRQLAYFPDITGYDREMQHAIAMFVELMIAEGSGGNFMPNEQATRAQVATMLVYLKEVLVRLENK